MRETSHGIWAICSVLSYQHRKEILPCVQVGLPGHQFPCLPVLLLGTTEQNLVPPLTPSLEILAENDGVPIVLRADSGTLDWKPSHLQKPCPPTGSRSSTQLQWGYQRVLCSCLTTASQKTHSLFKLGHCFVLMGHSPTSQESQPTL